MDQRLNWSLVLLVFILASHITDVLARHHHIKLRHARHRRQHGEGYLPASFISDTDEEEAGNWGPWSSPSSCSRSCGGGVGEQTRSCQDGDNSCTGAKKRFFSCNIQDCPDPTADFRAEQCAEFNNASVSGIYYEWIPYTGGLNKCELNCMPRGERFFYRHKQMVTDGTPCTTQQNDVCVQGKCRPVGCDMMLGSDTKEDRCRECGGDGSACDTVHGVLDSNDLQVGYNDILLIPAGATNIAISEKRPSNNYLAVRNLTDHYYLNGNWRIDFPRSLRFAGSLFHYERKPKDFSAADIINTLGPTNETLYIVLLYQDTNVGVNYEYSIPKRFSKKSDPDSYTWVVDEFSDCSATCAGGIRSRHVRCVKRVNQGDIEEVDGNLCDQQLEPAGTQVCGVEPCAPGWVTKDWGPCSKTCGSGGEQSRVIQCQQIISGDIPSIVDDYQCLELIGPKDIVIQECNTDVVCPQWHIGPWKPCNRLCGKGKQTRRITCYKKVEGKIFVLDDSACGKERPDSEKDCELRPCAGVDWVVSKWSGCDKKCGLTHETRTTSCVTLAGEVYPPEQCNSETKPKLVKECSAQEKCDFIWHATEWSECSVKCGTGIQTRTVFCGTSPSGNECIRKVPDEKCDAAKKYNSTKDCTAEVEECKGEWFAGPFSECSKSCGGGEKTRKVMCMRDNQVVSPMDNCYENDIIYSVVDCNMNACEADETIPVGEGKPSAPTEDEEVECEDYQDDEFVSVALDFDTVGFENDEGMDTDASVWKSFFDLKSSGGGLEDLMMGDIDVNPDESSGDHDETAEGSGFDSPDDENTELPETYDADQTSFAASTESTVTFSTESTDIDSTSSSSTESTSSGSTESTLSGSTESTSSGSTESTSSGSTESTSSSSTESISSGSTESTPSGSTESTSSSSTESISPGSTESTPSGSTESTSSGSTESISSGSTESTPSGSTESTLSGSTESIPSGSTESISSGSTESTLSGSTEFTSSTGGTDESVATKLTSSETSASSTSSAHTTETTTAPQGTTQEKFIFPGIEQTLPRLTTIQQEKGHTSITIVPITTENDFPKFIPETTIPKTTVTSQQKKGTTVLTTKSISTEDNFPKFIPETTIPKMTVTPRQENSNTVTTESGITSDSTSVSGSESSNSLVTDASSKTSEFTIISSSKDTIFTTLSESSTSDTSTSSSADTTLSSSSATSSTSTSDTTISPSSDTTLSPSLDTSITSSSGTSISASSDTTISASSDTTTSSSADTTLLSSSDTSSTSSSEATQPSSLGTSISSSSGTSSTFSSETTAPSSSDTTISSSSDTTISSSTETTLSSSAGSTLSSSADTTLSSSLDTTVSSSLETKESSTETTVASSSEITESTSVDTSVPSSTDTTILSSLDTTVLSSSEPTESSSSDTTISSSSDATGSSSSADVTEMSSSQTSVLSSSDTTTSGSSSVSTATTESSMSTDITGSESTGPFEQSTETDETSESEITSVSGETDITSTTDETGDTTETGITSDTTESAITETDEDLDTTGQSHITDIWTTISPVSRAISTEQGPPKCRPRKRKTCKYSPFGCCYDGIKAATGPFGKGCPIPRTCKETEFGCCSDEVSPALGRNNQGCPDSHCSETLFGCCPDNVTAAESNDYEGCPIPCNKSEFGCCPDENTPAAGKDNLGCCNVTTHGCCPDGIKPASGPDGEGCDEKETSTVTTPRDEVEITTTSAVEVTTTSAVEVTSTSTVEITSTSAVEVTTTSAVEVTSTSTVEDTSSSTAAVSTLGEVEEGCTNSEFGCCPNNKTTATGKYFEGCGVINTENCTVSYYGCCPDGVSAALGPNNEECHMDCENSPFGCCDDGSTPAHGLNKEGCCLTTPYGCCLDNIQLAQGHDFYGCSCQYSRYGCCPDNTTTARGSNNEGCSCEHTPHGCCPNRIATASGPDFEGCACHTYQFGCCPDGVSIAKGPQGQGCGCENTEFKCCSDGVTAAQGTNYAGCTCDASKYGCCQDGAEEAQGENFEGCLTVPSSPGAACALERDRGSCSNFSVRWFFDTEYGGCSRFWYGGCEGNENRFKSDTECQDVCVEPKGRDACFLPKISGPCEGYNPTWYYDTDRKQCGQFIYSGCLGNANKFQTKDECEELCIMPDDIDACEQSKEVGPCEGNFTRWYFNKETDSCEEFTYGGCKANKNNFLTKISCQQKCLTPGRSRVQDVCALEKEPGPCPGSLLRWYYDAKRKSCRQFVYGGCKGNGNKFRTYAACEQRCPIRDSCSLLPKEGECAEKHARWFFDQSKNRCMPFYYTGCGANRNNYETRDACDSDCPPKIEQDICLLPALLGDCYNYTQRWYYDSYDQRCRPFYYGGCGGNGNNFATEHDCTHRCEPLPITPAPIVEAFRTEFCFLPEDFGSCNGDSVKWFYDSRDGVCKEFRYGGCAGNSNKFNTAEECESRCGNVQDHCQLPLVVGTCRAAFTKYYYDSRTDLCHKFIFGGCQGNKNNFEDKTSCEQRCRKSTDVTTTTVGTTLRVTTELSTRTELPVTTISPVTEIPLRSSTCSLPVDSGPCKDDVTAYYYDSEAGACQAFIYGGCEGNANRFQTQEQCERLCGSFLGQDVCNIRADPGPCRGAFPKFYYDPNIRGCSEFTYGGCDGNANRFTSEQECESVCIHREEISIPGNRTTTSDREICGEPVSSGSCSAGSYKRFYYNEDRLDCIAFIYTGCGGNRNRFKNYDTCIRTCWSPAINEVDIGPPGPAPKDPCIAARAECSSIRCPYGKEDYVDQENCQHCRCADPCRSESCPEGTKCAISLVKQGDATGYQSICRSILKPGNCPKVSNTTTCEEECNSDADCINDFKCCANGCGSSCIEPAPTEPLTTSRPRFDVTVPYPDAVPAAIQKPEETNVSAGEGSYVILKCLCTGNPRPLVTWRKGVTLIDNSVSRYSISVEGSLQIVSLYRTDAGIYTCTADNHLAPPVRIQYQLDVTDPHEHTPVILGEPNYRVTVTLNSPAVLQCYATGWPRPIINWWHGERMLPVSDGVFQLQRDNSLRIHRVELIHLGVYTCQAWNGILRPASWSVTLQAPGPVYNMKSENMKYAQYLIEPERRPVPSTVRPQITYRPRTTKAPQTQTYAPLHPVGEPYTPPVISVTDPSPEIVPGKFTVPVTVNISVDEGPFPEGSEFSIACIVDGFPIPRVGWFKDDIPIQANNRIAISDVNRLTISDAKQSDAGKYRCQAANEYTSDADAVDIKVAGIYIPLNCQDNSFFAKCDLIVKGNFCNHQYYARFCCRSCTEAGQLSARGPHINETRRKRRSILSFL